MGNNKLGKLMKKDVLIKNKRATFDYELVDKFTAGIVLVGTEIKSIRLGKASLVDTFCFFAGNNELWVKNMNISEYSFGSYNNHLPRRDRKLLLNRKELIKLQREVKDNGMTIVPTKLFINEKGLCKLEIALARGKKEYDKRESIKEKDAKRDIDRYMKR
jgi:SsrA-binding protein